MKRYAGMFKIKQEFVDEYRKAHEEIWPEMAEAISGCGIRNHSLFLGPEGRVIIYAEADDLAESMRMLAGMDVNTRWQQSMRRFFTETDENTGGARTELFAEIFHLE